MLCTFTLIACRSEGETSDAAVLPLEELIRAQLDVVDVAPGQPRMWVDLEPASSHFGNIYVLGAPEDIPALAADLSARLQVYQHDTHMDNPATPPMLGRLVTGKSSAGDPGAAFIPRFPLVAGLSYRVVYKSAGDIAMIDTVFSVPQFSLPTEAAVLDVFPSADTLPENLLKFYIHFSGEMADGRAYEHLSIIDRNTGEPVEAPFVVMEPELWDPDHMRFTLLFDPGRIKRSVALNLELGPPLKPGHDYDLVIDQQWQNVQGLGLSAPYVKSFHVTAADREMPAISDWGITPPAAESRQPLGITFDEPMDHALLQRLIRVLDGTGRSVEGRIRVGDGERAWSFTPDDQWTAGRYEIRVNTILEDVAGNTLRSLFDVDLQTSASSEVREAVESESLFFNVIPTHSTAP